ncbi:cytochrome P450 [Calothrix sp. UHCC 0171]|uniref:cytochrome P450 n=1 Tax=Calothrix sp. UHCC 0171 TaxID=3110245 RepID=UPI002B1F748C|nr:cytochrome P450 [Calothrix sp. UHCC 0171]MEA5573833.1 cytochrome P450 [Calothrix sp. UHCC 0171]
MTNKNTINSLPLPPGDFGLPLIGESLDFLRDPNFTKKRQEKYGSVFKTHIFGQPTIIASGADANKYIFTNENKYFTNNWPKSTKELLGAASLSVQVGAEHQKRRKILSQAFQPRALSSYISTIEANTYKYFEHWENLGNFAWYPEIKNYTLDIACKLLVGTESASQTQLGDLYTTWVNGLFSLGIKLPWTTFGKAWESRQLLLQKIEKIIQERISSNNSQADALGLLIQAEDEEGNRLSIEELKDQILTLIFAGHETLTSAIACFCLLVVQHPQVLASIRQEQEELGLNMPITLENLKQMTYLEQVLKETLRLIPPVGGGFRKVTETCEFNGYQIPQGWSLLYQIGYTHKDINIYPQPEQFDPERFNFANAEEKSKAFSFVPFGGGLRECIGKEFAKLEIKIFAALLARNYQWELIPQQNLDLVMVPTPRPKDGLKVNFHRIH